MLQWWSDAGVDILIDEQPRDWLRPEPARPAVFETPAPPPEAPAPRARVAAPPPPAAPAEELPGQIDLFHAYLRTSERLSFAAPAAPRVCPSGDPASGLMIMTDMPTSEDCATGTLLSGESGRLFDRMLAAIGRDRDSIYLAALSCLRSPDGRLASDAARNCATLALHHAGLVQPRALLLFGDYCSKALTGLAMAQARGRWHEVRTQSGPIKALVSIPPSVLLTHPAYKALAWADLQMLIEEVNR